MKINIQLDAIRNIRMYNGPSHLAELVLTGRGAEYEATITGDRQSFLLLVKEIVDTYGFDKGELGLEDL